MTVDSYLRSALGLIETEQAAAAPRQATALWELIVEDLEQALVLARIRFEALRADDEASETDATTQTRTETRSARQV